MKESEIRQHSKRIRIEYDFTSDNIHQKDSYQLLPVQFWENATNYFV